MKDDWDNQKTTWKIQSELLKRSTKLHRSIGLLLWSSSICVIEIGEGKEKRGTGRNVDWKFHRFSRIKQEHISKRQKKTYKSSVNHKNNKPKNIHIVARPIAQQVRLFALHAANPGLTQTSHMIRWACQEWSGYRARSNPLLSVSRYAPPKETKQIIYTYILEYKPLILVWSLSLHIPCSSLSKARNSPWASLTWWHLKKKINKLNFRVQISEFGKSFNYQTQVHTLKYVIFIFYIC